MAEMLSSAQVGRRLGVSSARVRALRREGRLPAISTALGHLHPVTAVEALERERELRQQTNAPVVPTGPAKEPVEAELTPLQAQVLDFLRAGGRHA